MVAVPRAVLWDMDGTLVDSEEQHWISWEQTMADQGHPITRQQFRKSFGQRNDTILTNWLGASITPQFVSTIGDAKEQRYRNLVRSNGTSLMPGADHWIHRLHAQDWRQAIASAAPRLNVEAILDVLKIADCFQGIVSAEDVKEGKPDPEVFLAAAARVGVVPARCIVVEDAAAGIEGARRAGMRSIGVSRTALLKADLFVASLDLLQPDAFESLLSR